MKSLLDKKWKWAVAIILLPIAIVLLYGLYTYVFYTCCSEQVDEEPSRLRASCESEGGFFIEALEQCQLPTTDARKTCKNSSECEGFCETDLSAEEISKVANGELVEKTGACGGWKNFHSGCFYIVEDAAVERFCAD